MSRAGAATLAVVLLLVVVLAVAAEQAHGDRARQLELQRSANAISSAFGRGPLFACMAQVAWRESRFEPHAENLEDRHADGSRGSWGLFEIGSLWRRHGETVAHFRARMLDPLANAREARRLYRLYGLQPWGGSCR